MAETSYSTKFPFAALPMRWFPTKELRRKANEAVVEVIAWDSILFCIQYISVPTHLFVQMEASQTLAAFLKFTLPADPRQDFTGRILSLRKPLRSQFERAFGQQGWLTCSRWMEGSFRKLGRRLERAFIVSPVCQKKLWFHPFMWSVSGYSTSQADPWKLIGACVCQFQSGCTLDDNNPGSQHLLGSDSTSPTIAMG